MVRRLEEVGEIHLHRSTISPRGRRQARLPICRLVRGVVGVERVEVEEGEVVGRLEVGRLCGGGRRHRHLGQQHRPGIKHLMELWVSMGCVLGFQRCWCK